MKFVGLISGGKDSIFSICTLKDEGHELVSVLYIHNEGNTVDSFMYQTVGKELIAKYEECLGVPLFVHKTGCRALNTDLEYVPTPGDEVEDLYDGLKSTLAHVQFTGVSSGAIMSVYQKNRVESACTRLNLESLAPLFRMEQKRLLDEMIDYGIDARVVKVAGAGLTAEALNQDLCYIRDVCNKSAFTDVNYCGEGGEYETMVVDAPHFVKRIQITDFEVRGHADEVGKCQNVFFIVVTFSELVDKAQLSSPK